MSSVQKINDELFVYVNEEVGSGTFGMVFKGMYKNEACAIKMLHHVATPLKINFPVGQGQQNAIRAFDHESMVLESFQHPNVLQHLATTEHPSGNIMLVTELMDCNLSIYLSTHDHSSSLTSQCEISLSKDLASGLAYIHSRKIIHRDLCGVNVLLKQSRPFPVAKISDFGMSKLLDPSKFNTTISHRLGYLPPEALHEDDEDYDETLDVFSLGVIMIQIACRLENVKSVRERSSYLSEIKAGTHLLKLHIMTCLQDKRPSAAVVCGQLEKHLLYGDAYRQDYDLVTIRGERPILQMHSESISGLAERIDIEHPLLNNEIETTEFPILACHFDNVKMYSLALGLTPAQQADVRQIKVLEDTQTAMMQCLSLWQRSNPAAATYRTLLKLLVRMRKHEIANEVFKHCLENSKLT